MNQSNCDFGGEKWNNDIYVDELQPTNLNCNKNGRNIYKDSNYSAEPINLLHEKNAINVTQFVD